MRKAEDGNVEYCRSTRISILYAVAWSAPKVNSRFVVNLRCILYDSKMEK